MSVSAWLPNEPVSPECVAEAAVLPSGKRKHWAAAKLIAPFSVAPHCVFALVDDITLSVFALVDNVTLNSLSSSPHQRFTPERSRFYCRDQDDSHANQKSEDSQKKSKQKAGTNPTKKLRRPRDAARNFAPKLPRALDRRCSTACVSGSFGRFASTTGLSLSTLWSSVQVVLPRCLFPERRPASRFACKTISLMLPRGEARKPGCVDC